MITVSTSKPYHHGNLRAALLETALAELEAHDFEELSLRGLARAVGVSPTAVYRHFPDKRALLTALAAEGLRALGVAQQTAHDAAGGGAAGFAATGRAYVRFALARPGLFRMAFTHAGAVADPTQGGDPASRLLQANAAALAHGDAARARTIALQGWASAHGLAMLILDGRLPADDAIIDAVLDSRTLIAGQGSSSEASP